VRPEARDPVLACALRARRNAEGGRRETERRAAGAARRSGGSQGLDGERRPAVRKGRALAAGRAGALPERDRAMGRSGAREPYPARRLGPRRTRTNSRLRAQRPAAARARAMRSAVTGWVERKSIASPLGWRPSCLSNTSIISANAFGERPIAFCA